MTFRCIRCQSEMDPTFNACPRCGQPVTDFLRRYRAEPVDGKYELVERLGEGGMGEVYKVHHTFLGTTRVIKVIRPQISESKDAHDRFLREARLATKVQDPNVATLHDFSALPDGSHYMVWEYIEGENLAQRIQSRGTLSPRYAVRVAIDALHGLDAIHRAGIVHRDISPENIMLTREAGGSERVKIIDLGVAKTDDADSGTRTGVFVGKLRYASPEHLGFLEEGEKIDGRADLYSLAIVLYEMLAGRPPFEASTPHQYILLHSRETQFRPLDLPAELPGGGALQTVMRRALERDRNKRFASARDFATALEEVERSLPDPNAMRTVHQTPTPDPDATIRATPPPAYVPAPPTAPATRVSPRPPVAPPVTPPPRATGGSRTGLIIGTIVTLGLLALVSVIAVVILLHRASRATEPAPTQIASAPVTATQAPPSQTTLDVITETTPAAPVTTTTAAPPPPPVTTTTAAPAPPPRTTNNEQRTTTVEPPTEAEPPPPPPAPTMASGGKRYVEGGDEDSNEAALASLRSALGGVSSVAIRGSGDELMTRQLGNLLREEGISVVDGGADITVQFNGTIERLGRGRKRRAAEAVVLKNGRAIFRYEMPSQDYRVGDTPAEAFARVLVDGFDR